MTSDDTFEAIEDAYIDDVERRAAQDRALAHLGRIICASLARHYGGQWFSVISARSGGGQEGEA